MSNYTEQIEKQLKQFKKHFQDNFKGDFQSNIELNNRVWQLSSEYQIELMKGQFKFNMDVFTPNFNFLKEENYSKDKIDIIRESYMKALKEFNESNISSANTFFNKLGDLYYNAKKNTEDLENK